MPHVYSHSVVDSQVSTISQSLYSVLSLSAWSNLPLTDQGSRLYLFLNIYKTIHSIALIILHIIHPCRWRRHGQIGLFEKPKAKLLAEKMYS